MGSWDVSCGPSGLHIGYNDKVAIVPIIMRPRLYEINTDNFKLYGKTSIVTDGNPPNYYFEESMFPIFGVYDDYGRITDIVKDDNTKCLEEYFELTIEQIADTLCDNRKDEIFYHPDMTNVSDFIDMSNPRHVFLMSCSITWIHGELYEQLSDLKSTSDNIGFGNKYLLEDLGFKYEGIDETKSNYSLKFSKDGKNIYTNGRNFEEFIWRVKELKEYFIDKEIKVDLSEFEKKSFYEQQYDYVLLPLLEEYKSFLKPPKDIKEIKEKGFFKDELNFIKYLTMIDTFRDDFKLLLKVTDPNILTKENSNSHKLFSHAEEAIKDRANSYNKSEDVIEKEVNQVKDITDKLENNSEDHYELHKFYGQKILENGNNFLRKNISEWFTVKDYYYYLGKFLYPIGVSPQCGEVDMTLNFMKAVVSINQKQVDELDNYDEEDE